MSVPARVQYSAPAARPQPRLARPKTAPARRVVSPDVAPTRRRVRHHVGFAVLASLLVGGMVVGLVTLNALLAQTSFRLDDLRAELDDLADQHAVLTRQAAHLSAPGRIADRARRRGMHLPDEIQFLPVRGTGGTDTTTGGRTFVDAEELRIRHIPEGVG